MAAGTPGSGPPQPRGGGHPPGPAYHSARDSLYSPCEEIEGAGSRSHARRHRRAGRDDGSRRRSDCPERIHRLARRGGRRAHRAGIHARWSPARDDPDRASLRRGQREDPKLALDLSAKVCTNSERGLLGVAVDPAFATNGFVYLYYTGETATGTCPSGTRVPRIGCRASMLSGDRRGPGERGSIFDGVPSYSGNHNAGDLAFGPDGKLYVSIGDGGCDYAGGGARVRTTPSRDPHVALGKILRINPDGSTPTDNPFAGETDEPVRRRRTSPRRASTVRDVRLGLPQPVPHGVRARRSPVRQRRRPGHVGGDRRRPGRRRLRMERPRRSLRDRLDRPTAAPRPPGSTNPIYDYNATRRAAGRSPGRHSSPTSVWPVEYRGDYLFADFVCGKIFRLEQGAGGGSASRSSSPGSATAAPCTSSSGPDQALYYTTYAGGGQVRKIVVRSRLASAVASDVA